MRTILTIADNGRLRGGSLLVSLAMIAAACSPAVEEPFPQQAAPLVVTTTSILGDVVVNLVDGEAEVEVLIPSGTDPHEYQASPRQVARLRQADLVVANGLGLEETLADVLAAAAADGVKVLEVGPRLDPLPLGDVPCDPESGVGCDPHVWMDPLRMVEAARLIAAELADIAPEVDWASRAESYVSKLEAAHEEIVGLLADIPEERRVLVTNHEALGYFADRYGLEVLGAVIPGGSTLGEPSSADLAALVELIRVRGVPAIFAETTQPLALAEAVAAEAGRPVAVVRLYTGSLGAPGSGAETLVGMLLTDARLIAEALR
ncbi:MAG: metal ABC transporter solute-binding protein, Zn/Mn family [Acidimicrobiia bacterium]